MNTYKLLTPGPLTTTDTVKREMMVDRCTWDDDYKVVTQKIRRQLLELAHVSEDDYTAVLMQGSGTFGVESVLTSEVGDQDKVLICSNGAYGKRMTDICTHSRVPFVHYAQDYDKVPDAGRVAHRLAQDTSLRRVLFRSARPPAVSSTISSRWARWSGMPARPLSWTRCPPSVG